jgi:signal transduction histidine kinase
VPTHPATAAPAAAPSRSTVVPGRWPTRVQRALALAVVPLYLAGAVAFVVLSRSTGSLGSIFSSDGTILPGFLVFAAMGSLVAFRRPRNALGWVMSAAALLIVAGSTGDAYAAWVMTTRGHPDVLAVIGGLLQSSYWIPLIWLIFVLVPALFPDGRLPSRRWWIPMGLSLTGVAAATVLGLLAGTLTGQKVDYRIANPIGISGFPPVEQTPAFGVLGVLLLLGIGTAIAAVVVRFRRSRGDERQQMKVFLYAMWPLVLAPLAGVLPSAVGSIVFAWLVIAVPVAVAIAVLRYRLDGIDVVINRTLVYLALTAVVAGVYVLIVGYLGAAFAAARGNLTVNLVAAGAVAVLFAPVRDRLQRGVNRLLYGQRAEPYAALSRLGERLEAALAPGEVLPTIVQTVREALRLPYAAIALPDDGHDERVVATAGGPVPEPVRVPLLYQNEPVGTLLLAPRPGQAGFSPADRRLLSDLARHAGVAVSAVRLTADLQRSRERLVATREEERRRLRRDLHDGLGAQLAGLTVQTGVLRSLIPRDPAAAEQLAGELRGELKTAIADIRRLVYDLRPPALDELGLAGALQRLAEAAGGEGLRIAVETPTGLPPLPAAVEVAVYRIAQEALANVVRHARARCCTVRLAVGADAVVVEVQDDGVGLPGEAGRAGVGTASMRERAAEMGGECVLQSAPGDGTLVRARLPRPGGD